MEFIHAVLEGREVPHSVRQIEQRLGLGRNTLAHHFPKEAALVSAQYRTYRTEQARQRMQQKHDEVRTATFSLYAQGIFPSQSRVSSAISKPPWMRDPDVRIAWHAALCELGLEP